MAIIPNLKHIPVY